MPLVNYFANISSSVSVHVSMTEWTGLGESEACWCSCHGISNSFYLQGKNSWENLGFKFYADEFRSEWRRGLWLLFVLLLELPVKNVLSTVWRCKEVLYCVFGPKIKIRLLFNQKDNKCNRVITIEVVFNV